MANLRHLSVRANPWKESTLENSPTGDSPDTALRKSKTPKCLESSASAAPMWLTKGNSEVPRNAAWRSLQPRSPRYSLPRHLLHNQEPHLPCEPQCTCCACFIGSEMSSTEHTKIAFVRDLDASVCQICINARTIEDPPVSGDLE
jgi:hypothetical protein